MLFKKVGAGMILSSFVIIVGAVYGQADNTKPSNEVSRAGAMEEIIVRGTNQSRYIVNEPDPVTGLDLDFLENPRSVTVLPEQLILDRKITTLEEALRNVPGVVAGDGFGGTRDDFFIRGFRRNAEYRNGFRRQTSFKANLSNIEFTRVIRGPAAIT
ncbi:MAG: TonB-dependent receptor plug domain-containing protein, partial [Parahaliea sp.]